MYPVKPVFTLTGEFEHTSCILYKLKTVNMNPCTIQAEASSNLEQSSHGSSGKEVDILVRQEKLLNELNILQDQLNLVRNKIIQNCSKEVTRNDICNRFRIAGIQDIVINADPQYPPYALLWLSKLWNLRFKVSVHLHSSVSSLPDKLAVFNTLSSHVLGDSVLKITFVWKDVGPDAQLVVSPVKNKVILGEVNILRFFDTCISENGNLTTKIKNNEILDIAHRLNHVSGKEVYALVSRLTNILETDDSFMPNQSPSVVGTAVWSVLCRKTKLNALPSNIRKFASSYSSILDSNDSSSSMILPSVSSSPPSEKYDQPSQVSQQTPVIPPLTMPPTCPSTAVSTPALSKETVVSPDIPSVFDPVSESPPQMMIPSTNNVPKFDEVPSAPIIATTNATHFINDESNSSMSPDSAMNYNTNDSGGNAFLLPAAEVQRALIEQQLEVRHQRKELDEKERLRVENEKRRGKEEEEALEKSRKSVAEEQLQSSGLLQSHSHPRSQPLGQTQQSLPHIPGIAQPTSNTKLDETKAAVVMDDGLNSSGQTKISAERQRLRQREQERRRREALESRIGMNFWSNCKAAFE